MMIRGMNSLFMGDGKITVLCAILVACYLSGLPVAGQNQPASHAPPIAVAERGATSYVICHDAAAPRSVKAAAEELQRVIKVSTGVEIPIQNDPAAKMIRLGDGHPAREAGLSLDGLPDEGFRMATRGASIYIVGRDTRDGEKTKGGGESCGTLWGVMDFLERFVGARWLMPDEIGEHIPRHEPLSIPPLSLSDGPDFLTRGLKHLYRDSKVTGNTEVTPDIQRWYMHNRIGLNPFQFGSYRVPAMHAWQSFPSIDVLRAHPEYMAYDGKSRMTVPANLKQPSRGSYYCDEAGNPWRPIYCTSQPGLIQAFADSVVAYMDEHPERRYVSICPPDGKGWYCKCLECLRYVEEGPSREWGNRANMNCTVSPLILKFYNDVARIVARKHPDRYVVGYVYADYLFPPEKPMTMEPQVILSMAVLHLYGMALYRPDCAAEYDRLCAAWGRISKNPLS